MSQPPPIPPRPNVMFFFTDDQRFDTIHALGNERIHTPNLDALAASGTTFTHAHIMGGSCGAVCMPSRAMLMTGRTLFHIEREGQNIPEEHVMLPEVFRRAGYATFGTGKWHNGTSAYARAFSDGAEIFFGGMDDHWNVPSCDFDPSGKYPEPKDRSRNLDIQYDENNKPFRRIHTAPQVFDHVREGRHSTDLFADSTIDFLNRVDANRPFFAYVSFMAPHDPRLTHRRFHDAYPPDSIELPRNFLPEHPFDNGEMDIRDEKLGPRPRTPDNTKKQIGEYYAMIAHVDEQIGRVMDALRATGRRENTIVVFAGDNGLAVGRHGLMGKQNLYEHSVRVPLIFSGPGIPAGQRRRAFCYLLDIFPTLCELTGMPIPDTVEGHSLSNAILHPAATVRDSLLYAYRDLQRGARIGDHKLIEYAVDGKRTTQLFDLAKDPFEMKNLAEDAAHAESLTRLRNELRRWREELDDPCETFWDGF